MPVCFVLDESGRDIHVPLDEKPKQVADPRRLARVRDIEARPRVTLLADRWDEDWTKLAWVRVAGEAVLTDSAEPAHLDVIERLRQKYPQYREHRLEERPLIRIRIRAVRSWGLPPG